MCSQKFRKKNKPFVPRDKNDQICTMALFIYTQLHFMVFIYLQSFFKVIVSEIQYIHPVVVVGTVIMHKMFCAGTKHLSATDDQLKVFLGPCG